MLGLRVSVLVAIAALSACAATPSVPPEPPMPPVQPRPLAPGLVDWAERGRDMVWSHLTVDPVPDLPLRRFEMCDAFGIAFFDSSDHRLLMPDGAGGFIDDDLLWAAGTLSEPPENADGGFVATVQDPDLDTYRTNHGPCEVAFQR